MVESDQDETLTISGHQLLGRLHFRGFLLGFVNYIIA